MSRLLHLAGLLSATSGAFAQNTITLPPHHTTFHGASRGWRTMAQTPFVISGLSLPPEAYQAGDTASYLVLIDGVQVLHSIGNAGAIAANLLVEPGQVVTVVGNWSGSPANQWSAHNSYGSPTGTTMIEGVPHTLLRSGWQWDVGDPSFGGSVLHSASGLIGRVYITTTDATGFATRAALGSGCHDLPRMVYERFGATSSALDLANTQWVLDYGPSLLGGHYSIAPGGPAYDAGTAAQNGVDLTQQAPTVAFGTGWNDACSVRTLPLQRFPNGLPFPAAGGGTTGELTINSNGRVLFGDASSFSFASVLAPYTSLAYFQGVDATDLPMLAAWYCDLDPSAGGQIYYEDNSPGGGVRVTWHGVPNYQGPGGPPALPNDVQLELLPSGRLHLSFGPSLGTGGAPNNDAYVGYSAGGGEIASAPVDWSGLSGYASGDGSTQPSLECDLRPILGTTVTLTVGDAMPQSPLAALALGVNEQVPPAPLDAIGMPGCLLYVVPDVIDLLNVNGTSASRTLSIPTTPTLAGNRIAAQGLVLNGGYRNPLHGAVSRGLSLTFDTQ